MASFTSRNSKGNKQSPVINRFREFRESEEFRRWTRSATSDRIFWLFFSTWLLPLVGAAVIVAVNLSSLPKEVPLFYSLNWGEEQLTRREYLLLPLGGVFLFGIIDFLLGAILHPKDKVMSYLLFGTATLATVLAVVTVLNIVKLLL